MKTSSIDQKTDEIVLDMFESLSEADYYTSSSRPNFRQAIFKLIDGIKEELFSPEHLFLKFFILLIIIACAVIIFFNLNNQKNIIESFFRRLKIHIFGYDINLNKDEFIQEQKNRLYMKSADYIDDMYQINGEEILYRFKEKPKAIKELSYLTYILPGLIIVPLIITANTLAYTRANNWIYAMKMTLLFIIITVISKFIISLFPRQLKSCRSWAVSDNYFIQVQDGLVEIELKREDIFYIDFTGHEIIFDLNGINSIALEDSGRDDRLVIEDVEDIKTAYAVIKEWLNPT